MGEPGEKSDAERAVEDAIRELMPPSEVEVTRRPAPFDPERGRPGETNDPPPLGELFSPLAHPFGPGPTFDPGGGGYRRPPPPRPLDDLFGPIFPNPDYRLPPGLLPGPARKPSKWERFFEQWPFSLAGNWLRREARRGEREKERDKKEREGDGGKKGGDDDRYGHQKRGSGLNGLIPAHGGRGRGLEWYLKFGGGDILDHLDDEPWKHVEVEGGFEVDLLGGTFKLGGKVGPDGSEVNAGLTFKF